jgi:hypothetical protein
MLACFYHWYTAGLYASPVVLIGGWVFYSNRRHRRHDGPDDGPPETGAPLSSFSP